MYTIQKSVLLGTLGACAALGILGLYGVMSQHASASGVSWLQGEITGKISETGPAEEQCIKQVVPIGHAEGPKTEVCVYQAKGWRYGLMSKKHPPVYGQSYIERSFVISFGSDKAMYKVSGLSDTEVPVYVANSNNLIYDYWISGSTWGRRLVVIKDLPSTLERESLGGLPASTGYKFRQAAQQVILQTDDPGSNEFLRTGGVSVSSNGQWLVTEWQGAGLVRIDMRTFEKVWFSKYAERYGLGSNPRMLFAVSDDGKHIATVGSNTSPRITQLSDDCGRRFMTPPSKWRSEHKNEDIQPCPERTLYSDIENAFGDHFGLVRWAAFDFEAGELMLRAGTDVRDEVKYEEKWVALRAPGYSPLQLEYLALGDSYSSGEGDTERSSGDQKYYRPLTDTAADPERGVPEEKCHISTRSYPYKLALGMDLAMDDPQQWNSVACSGATAWDVKEQASPQYEGQGGRLKGFDMVGLKEKALNEFIPGRQKQIEFVKKYRPKVITLTMGGNDVGFGDKLRYCTMPGTCHVASALRGTLAAGVVAQYQNLKTLYEELYKASEGESKIFVIGYPQFINSESILGCGVNVGDIDISERKMITNAVTYLNNVIEQAARAAGVKYIDIEDSLAGHTLCEPGEKYITGVSFRNENELLESFHPNGMGHSEIASHIKRQLGQESLLTYDTCPSVIGRICPDPGATQDTIEVPEHFQLPESLGGVAYRAFTDAVQVLNSPLQAVFGAYSFAKDSSVKITGYSSPVDFGEYSVNVDGSLSARIAIPSDLEPGYHLIVVKGKSYSGEDVEYEQIVLLKGSNSSDIDADGKDDKDDVCLFVNDASLDVDQDGVDDACDPMINETQSLYRARVGNPARLYSGTPESPHRIYIERNLNLHNTRDIEGDMDHDGDGWVIVAESLNIESIGIFARFWIDDSEKVPYLAFRTQEKGCVQYRPANLSSIKDDSRRGLVIKDEDTDTCRSEPRHADNDSDGYADDAQMLYRARIGDASRGEDKSSVYLERNTRAAEAQMGVSDYAKSKASCASTVTLVADCREFWSLLASLPLRSNGLDFKRLVISDSRPYVMVSHKIVDCLVYIPPPIKTIKKSTQSTHKLRLDWAQTPGSAIRSKC